MLERLQQAADWAIQDWWRRLWKMTVAIIFFIMLVSMVLYNVALKVENKVLTLGHETREIKEENRDLQLELDSVRSYGHVAASTAQMQGLQTATTIIDVVSQHPNRYHPPVKMTQPVPIEAYGY